ncbi:hypothetical protein IFM89_012377, partial [Coptis chinensis]
MTDLTKILHPKPASKRMMVGNDWDLHSSLLRVLTLQKLGPVKLHGSHPRLILSPALATTELNTIGIPGFNSKVSLLGSVVAKAGDQTRALPEEFCRLHLPNKDVMLTLVDEDQEEYPVKYLFCTEKSALISGWSSFSKAHKLVYIVRAYGLGTISPTGAFLHKNLSESINLKLAAGAISQTVDTADAIKGCNLSNSRDDFAALLECLNQLEHLGMNVVFLCARLKQLLTVATKSEDAVNHYKEAKDKRAQAEEEIMRSVKAKLSEIDTTIEPQKKEVKKRELEFREVLDSPCEQVLLSLDKAKSCAMERAKVLLTTLDPLSPSFVKALTQSYANSYMVYIIRANGLGATYLTKILRPKHASKLHSWFQWWLAKAGDWAKVSSVRAPRVDP